MAIHFNERYSGGAHVTATDEAKVKGAIIGGLNCVIDCGNNLAATVEPATGNISIEDGVFSFNGRCGWTDGATAAFTPASGDTVYKKIIAGLEYAKNTSTNEESISFKIYSSDEKLNQSDAESASISLPSDTITDSSATAFFPLWKCVVNASMNTEPTKLFNITESIESLRNKLNEEVNDRTNAISTEITNRNSAITSAINTEITNRNSAITSAINTEIANRNSAITSVINTEITNRNSAINGFILIQTDKQSVRINDPNSYYEAFNGDLLLATVTIQWFKNSTPQGTNTIVLAGLLEEIEHQESTDVWGYYDIIDPSLSSEYGSEPLKISIRAWKTGFFNSKTMVGLTAFVNNSTIDVKVTHVNFIGLNYSN